MSVLLGLPGDLVRVILSDWLRDATLRTFVLLDIALANHPLIGQYQYILSCSGLTYDMVNLDVFGWLLRREIDLSHISFAEAFIDRYDKSILDRDDVRSIAERLSQQYRMMCANVVSTFKAPKHVHFKRNACLLSKFKGHALEKLTSLTIESDAVDIDGTDLSSAGEHCRNLKDLVLQARSSDLPMRQALICKILEHNPHLEQVSIVGLLDCTVLNSMKHCSKVKYIDLFVEVIDLRLIEEFVKLMSATLLVVTTGITLYHSADKLAYVFESSARAECEEVLRQTKSVYGIKFNFPVTIDVLREVRRCGQDLSKLDIILDDEYFETIIYAVKHLPKLEDLCVLGTSQPHSFLMEALLDFRPPSCLIVLMMAGVCITWSDCIAIIQAWPTLKYLMLSEMQCGQGIAEFVRFLKDLVAATGRFFTFSFMTRNKVTVLRYENGTFSGRYIDDPSAFDTDNTDEVQV